MGAGLEKEEGKSLKEGGRQSTEKFEKGKDGEEEEEGSVLVKGGGGMKGEGEGGIITPPPALHSVVVCFPPQSQSAQRTVPFRAKPSQACPRRATASPPPPPQPQPPPQSPHPRLAISDR